VGGETLAAGLLEVVFAAFADEVLAEGGQGLVGFTGDDEGSPLGELVEEVFAGGLASPFRDRGRWLVKLGDQRLQ
jgi:hypothetical protein